MDTLVGEVMRWRMPPKADTGWHIITVRDIGGDEHAVTGCSLPRPGADVELQGEWQRHERFGLQFHARSVLRAKPPLTADGVVRWLCDRCPGIGPKRAAELLSGFGGDARQLWDGLQSGPQALERAGLAAPIAQAAFDALQAEGIDGEYQALLNGWGMTQRQIARVRAHWSLEQATKVLFANPYLLADHVQGFGFKRADAVAERLGIAHNDPVRVNAGLLHFLEAAAGEGHVFGDAVVFRAIAREMRIPIERLFEAARALRDRQRLVIEGGARVYLVGLYQAEVAAARDMRARFEAYATLAPVTTALGAAMPAVVDTAEHAQDPWQQQAIERLSDMRLPIAFVTGGPGTGKTTVLKQALDSLRAQGVRVSLAAPTGKAAKRMSEATGERAYTLHSLLGYKPTAGLPDCEACRSAESSFDFGMLNDEDPAMVIVDEASMVDLELWAALAEQGGSMRLRFVGDANQLPPVGPGQPFRDALETAPLDAVTRLQTVYRSKGEWVKAAAPLVLAGQLPPIEDCAGLRWLRVERADMVVPTVVAMMAGEHDTEQFRVNNITELGHMPILVPQRTGVAGVNAINRTLHDILNPCDDPEAPCVELEDKTVLRAGSWVMFTKNNSFKRVCNGDTGYVVSVEDNGTVWLTVDGSDAPAISYTKGLARDQIRLAYSTTVHKSQGSEYPWVTVVCHSSHKRMLTRRLLYTAITRAKEGVVLLGDVEGVKWAIDNAREVSRCTWLRQRLTGAV